MYEKTVLPNGVRIVTERIPHVRSVSLGFWYRVGSRDEVPETNGLCHFIEHMMFKGTPARTARQIAEAVDAAGGQMNAYTTKEHTCFYLRVLDDHLPFATSILADMLLHSTFSEIELEKEKGVIIEEIKMYEDSPDELVHDLFTEAILDAHPLGKGVIGTEANIAGVNRADILDFWREYYTADRLVVAAAGNVSHAAVVDAVAPLFAALPARMAPLTSTPVAHHSQAVARVKETEQVHICIGVPGIDRSHDDRYALYLVDTALGGGMSSRLFQELREERGLVYTTYSYHSCFQETGLFTVYAGCSPGNATQVCDLIQKEFQRAAAGGIVGEELSRSKEQLKGSLMLSFESTATRMSRIAKAELFGEPLLSPDELVSRIDGVTEPEVAALTRRLFTVEPTLAAIGPMAEGLTWQGADLAEAVASRRAGMRRRVRGKAAKNGTAAGVPGRGRK